MGCITMHSNDPTMAADDLIGDIERPEDVVFIEAARNFDFAALDRRMKALENLAEMVIYDNSDIGLVATARKALGS